MDLAVSSSIVIDWFWAVGISFIPLTVMSIVAVGLTETASLATKVKVSLPVKLVSGM